MVRRYGALPLAALLIAIVTVSSGLHSRTARAQPAEALSIDLDVTGNTATSLGPRDNCVSVSPGASITADITVEGVPPWVDSDPRGVINPGDSGGLVSYSYAFNFPSKSFVVSGPPDAPSNEFLLAANPGSAVFDASDATPEADSPWTGTALDTDSTNPESGSGVLTRLVLAVAGNAPLGVHSLSLSDVGLSASNGDFYLPGVLNHAAVAVGSECPAVIPIPDATPVPGGQPTDPPGTGETPPPDGTGGTPTGTRGVGSPTPNRTTRTSTASVTPSPTEAGGGDEDDDGSTALWIGLGLAGAALAATGGGIAWWRWRQSKLAGRPPAA